MAEALAVRRAEHESAELNRVPVTACLADGSRVKRTLETLAARDARNEILTAVRHFPAREAQWADFPSWIRSELRAAYQAKGMGQLYTHQAAACEAARAGKNLVIVTPTA